MFRIGLMEGKAMSKEWAWKKEESADPHGPFATRDEALEDAWQYGYDEILVGRVEWFMPEDYANVVGAEEIIERMGERVRGEVLREDPKQFDLSCDPKEAQALLDDLLAVWAKRCVRSFTWKMRDGAQQVYFIRYVEDCPP